MVISGVPQIRCDELRRGDAGCSYTHIHTSLRAAVQSLDWRFLGQAGFNHDTAHTENFLEMDAEVGMCGEAGHNVRSVIGIGRSVLTIAMSIAYWPSTYLATYFRPTYASC